MISTIRRRPVFAYAPRRRKPTPAALLALAFVVWLPLLPAAAADEAPDPHAHHHHMMMQGGMGMDETTRSIQEYTVPRVSLVREDGKAVFLPDEVNDGRAVALNFVYTTCTAICPLTSRIFSQLQSKLGSAQDKVHLVSISIDPENDTPPVLRAYAEKYGAGPDWQYYTGTTEASLAVQRAFNVDHGNKMDHTPVTFIRLAPGKPWIRIDGFASASDLAHEFADMVAVK